MPVRAADPAADNVGQYNRLSASQANQFRACPRRWFYEKVYRFKMEQIPVLYVGRAVEEALCRVLMDSPSLVMANAPADVLGPSPYSDDGVPEDPNERTWPAQRLLPLQPHERPQTIDDLEQWVIGRCRAHFPGAMSRAKAECEKDERRSGSWDEVDEDVCYEMLANGAMFHINEVERCFEENGGPNAEAWRRGKRGTWPAPDGFPHVDFAGEHPFAGSGDITCAEAWELARPWFVDPDAPKFTMNAVHPDHWFQGEYDLVYRWTGRPRIVDIKASVGAGDRSGDYVDQMRAYAMLWYVTHQRQEEVAELDIWYLGHPSVKSIPVPNKDEIAQIEEEMEAMWKRLRESTPSIGDCPPEPLPMRGYHPGGQPTDPPETVRCERCDWRAVCPGGDASGEPTVPSMYQLPGASQRTPLQSLSSLNPRITTRGTLFDVGYESEKRARTMTLKQGTNTAFVQVVATEHSEGGPTVDVELVRGKAVLVVDAVFTVNWKGEIVLKMDPFTRLVEDTDPSIVTSDLFDVQAKHNVAGVVVYTYEKSGVGKGGHRWSRRGMMVMDGTGAMKIEGWADDWNPQYEMVEAGDTVVVANLGLDAWAKEVKGEYTRNSRLHIAERVDRSTA